MATIKEQLEARIGEIVDNKNDIRDRLASTSWGITSSTADLKEIRDAILAVDTPGKILAHVSPGGTYTIPRGFHPGTGVVLGLNDEDVEAEKYKLYDQPDVTPTKTDQIIAVPENHYGLEPFTVKAIPHPYHDVSSVNVPVNMVHPNYTFVDAQGNIKQGSMPVVNPDNHTNISLKPSNYNHSVPTGKYYAEGSTYNVGIPETNFQVIQVTPEKNRIHHLASTNDKFISEVIVEPIPEAYVTGAYILGLLADI